MRPILPFLLSLFSCAIVQAQWWKVQTSGMDTNLRGVSVVEMPDAKGVSVPMVWISGSNGAILKSLDEGKTWKRLHVTSDEALDFRGLVAFSGKVASVMSVGEGEKLRIYKTTDSGLKYLYLFDSMNNLVYRKGMRLPHGITLKRNYAN